MNRKLAAVAVALVLSAVPMFAGVTFDPATGTGFVGKGDVQLAFGWNNKQIQLNQDGVGFSYESQATYVQSCMKVIEQKKETKVITKTQKKTLSVAASVSYDTRQRNQMTGYILTGIDAEGGDGPVGNDICPALGGGPADGGPFYPDPDGEYPLPTLIAGEGDGQALYVTFGGTKVRLNWPVLP